MAIDLGLGQPAEHMLRSSVIACGLADRLGLSREQKATVYYTTLLMWIGCHADSQEYARWFGDDISVRRDAYLVDWAGIPYLRFLLGNVARGEPLGQRVRVMATLMRDARGQLANLIHSHCTSAAALAGHLGLGPEVGGTLAYTFERYDGGGLPAGASGEDIPIEMRVAQLADVAEVHERTYGVQGAVAMARSRRGGHLDPTVVDAFTPDAEALFPAAGDDPWDRALSIAPDAEIRLDGPRLDELLTAIGDFVDLKCPFTLGHSRNVAALAEAAAVQLGLSGRRRHRRTPSRPPPRRRPDRRVQPGVVEAGRADRRRVGAGADAPLPHRPGADPHPRPRARGCDRSRAPRAPRRVRVPAGPRRSGARSARAAARRRGRLPVGAGAPALPRAPLP